MPRSMTEYHVKLHGMDWFDDPNNELINEYDTFVVARSRDHAEWRAVCEAENDNEPMKLWSWKAFVNARDD